MHSSGYKRFLTILMLIIILAVIGLVGYLGYDFLINYFAQKDAENAVDEFEQQFENEQEEVKTNEQENTITTPEPQNTNHNNGSNKQGTTVTYRDYNMIGTIQIPKIKLKSPIVDKVTPKSISAAVAVLYGPGLNQVGNTVIVGHNYRNGTFFSNNKKLVVGDKIYVTDQTGKKIEYTITNTYITSDTDFDYATRDTQGKREISLSTCTEDVKKRLVIWAREN
ncbi:MAG: sortase [Clostridia bacterium]|jgi:LPXTG-site transpeptidase (sortase) family protein